MQLIRNLLSNVCCPSFSAQQKSLKKHLKNNGEPQNHIGNTFYQAKRPPQLSPPPSSPPPPPPNCHQTFITALERLLLLSLTTALYLNSLPADFAYDDTRAITANDDLRPETPWSALLLHDYWGTPIGSSNSHGSYRPVTVATFRLNYLLHGLRPLGYHLGNLLLHGLVTALYTTVLQAAAVHRRVTLLSGLLFAAHPIHVEAVSSVVGRADLLAGAFYLASLNAYVRFVKLENSKKGRGGVSIWLHLYGSLLLAAASMFSKEHGITVLAVAAYYHLFVVHRLAPSVKTLAAIFTFKNSKKRFRCLRRGLLHLTVATAALLLLRLLIIPFSGGGTPTFSAADNPASASPSLLVRLLTFLYLPTANFALLLHPATLSFDWSMEAVPLVRGLADPRNLISVAFYGGLLLLLKRVIAFYRRSSLLKRSQQPSSRQLQTISSKPADCSRCEGYGLKNGHHFRNGHQFQQAAAEAAAVVDENNNNSSAINYNNSNADFDDNNNDASVPNRNYPAPQTESVFQPPSSHAPTNNNFTTTAFTAAQLSSKQKNTQQTTPTPKVQPSHYHSPLSSASSTVLCRLDCLSFSLALTIIPFLPASNLFFYVGFVIAERILYIPSFGYCLLLAVAIDQCLQMAVPRSGKQQGTRFTVANRRQSNNSKTAAIIYASTTVLLVAFSLRTVLRNVDWLTEENLYRSGVAVNPPKALGNLGNILKAQGRIEEAEAAYRAALRHRPNMADVHYNLGLLLQESPGDGGKAGRQEEALAAYQQAISYRPRLALAHLNLATVLTALGRREEAKAVYRRCAALDNTAGLKDVRAHETARIGALYNLARMLADEGDQKGAAAVLEEALRRAPAHYPALHSLLNVFGEVQWRLGDAEAAERAFRQALAVKGDHLPAHLTYAALLAAGNRTEEADALYRRALAFTSGVKNSNESSIVFQHYAQFTANTGNLEHALELYRRGLTRFPGHFELLLGAANVLRELRRPAEAETYYRQAAAVRPGDLLSWSNLGAIYHLNGKHALAMEAYGRALAISPEDAITRTNMAKLRTVMEGGRGRKKDG